MFLAKRVSTVRPLNPLATTFAPLQHDLVLPPSTPPPPVLVSTPPVSPVSADPLDFSLSDRLYLAVSPTVTGAFELASKVSSTFGSFFLTPSPVNPSSRERESTNLLAEDSMEVLASLLDKSGSKANQSVNAKSQDQFTVQSRNMDLFPNFPRSDDQDEQLN